MPFDHEIIRALFNLPEFAINRVVLGEGKSL